MNKEELISELKIVRDKFEYIINNIDINKEISTDILNLIDDINQLSVKI